VLRSLKIFLITILIAAPVLTLSPGIAVCWEPDGSVHVEAGLDGRCFDVIARSEQIKLDNTSRERCGLGSSSCVDAGTSIGQADAKGRPEFIVGHSIALFPLMLPALAMPVQMPKHTSRPQIPINFFASSRLSSVILRT